MKIILIIICLLECLLAIAYKHNTKLQDMLIDTVRNVGLENYLRNEFANKYIVYTIIFLVLVLLC